MMNVGAQVINHRDHLEYFVSMVWSPSVGDYDFLATRA